MVRYTRHRSCYQVLNRPSIKDALRAFLPPIKNDDARLDFYTIYKKEATEYDVNYVRKYDEDLNTTLIFVRRLPLALAAYLTRSQRLVCFLLSAQHLLSMSNQNWRPIQMSNLQPSSVPSSSLSTSLPSQAKNSLPHLSRKILPMRLLLPLGSCMQVF